LGEAGKEEAAVAKGGEAPRVEGVTEEAAAAKGGEAPVAEAGEVAEAVAASGFTEGFMVGFAEGGGLLEEEVQCIKTKLKDLMADLADAIKDLEAIVLKFQESNNDAQGQVRKIMGKMLVAMELMQSLVAECLDQEARQKVKQEIKALVMHLTSFTYMKNNIVAQWKGIEQDVFRAVTSIVNRNYEQGGEAIGEAMQLVLNSPPAAVQKYSLEDDSTLRRMFGTGANYHSSVLIALGVAFVLFVVFRVIQIRRALKVCAPACSRRRVLSDDVDTEAPRSAALFVAGESDGEVVE